MRQVALTVVGLLLLVGCAPHYMAPPGEVSKSVSLVEEVPAPQGSLFGSDQDVLGNDNLERIFAARVTLRPNARLAVLPLGQTGPWYWWSEDLAKLDQDITRRFLQKVAAGGRLADASLIPSLIVPEKRTIPYLREAAARRQADFLLAYRVGTRTYTKERLFARTKAKSYTILEAVLLDTRSGLVPFSTVVSQEVMVTRADADINESDMVRRAEMEATGQLLDQLAGQLVAFLRQLPAGGQ